MGPPWIEVACSKAGWFTSSSFHAHQEHMNSPDNANVKGMSLWMELRPLLLDVKLYTSQRCLLLLQHLWPTPETMNRCRPMPKSSSGVNNMSLASWRYFTVCLVYPFNLLICLKGVRSHLAFCRWSLSKWPRLCGLLVISTPRAAVLTRHTLTKQLKPQRAAEVLSHLVSPHFRWSNGQWVMDSKESGS